MAGVKKTNGAGIDASVVDHRRTSLRRSFVSQLIIAQTLALLLTRPGACEMTNLIGEDAMGQEPGEPTFAPEVAFVRRRIAALRAETERFVVL